jgi:hypothetical protein
LEYLFIQALVRSFYDFKFMSSTCFVDSEPDNDGAFYIRHRREIEIPEAVGQRFESALYLRETSGRANWFQAFYDGDLVFFLGPAGRFHDIKRIPADSSSGCWTATPASDDKGRASQQRGECGTPEVSAGGEHGNGVKVCITD